MLAEIILTFIIGVTVGVVGLSVGAMWYNKKYNKNITKTEK